MNLLNKLTVYNLKMNKKRTIVTVIGIVLSAALITAVASVFASGLQSVVNYETNEKGRFHAVFFDVPLEEANSFRHNRGIKTICMTSQIGCANVDSKNEYKPYVVVKGFTKDSLRDLSVKLTDGRMPENENEIVIPTHLKTNGRVSLSVGQEISLEVGKRTAADGTMLGQKVPFTPPGEDGTPKEYISDTVLKTYKIVGVAERPANNVEPYSAPGYTLITCLDESEFKGAADVYVRYTKRGVKDAIALTAGILGIDGDLMKKAYAGGLSENDPTRFEEELAKAKYEFDFNSYLITLETDPLSITGISTIGYAAATVIIIIVVTSVFCIKNSFDISITEKIRQYGMLRSVGATKKQVRKNVFFEASVLGALGLPLGILFGAAASYVLIIVSTYYIGDTFTRGFKLSFVFPWQTAVIAAALGVITIYLSAFRSANKAARVTPLDSIRGSKEIAIDPKKVSSPKIVRKVFGVGGELSYKNLKRNRRKYRATVVSVTVSVAVFISLSSFVTMAFEQADLDLESMDYNISLNAYEVESDDFQKLTETTGLENVQEFSIIRTAELGFSASHYNAEYKDSLGISADESATTYITVLCTGDEQFGKYCASLGIDRESAENKGILCDHSKVRGYSESGNGAIKYIRKFDFKKGDTVTGTIENASDGSVTAASIELAAVAEQRPFGLKNWSSPLLVVSDSFFESIAETGMVSIFYRSNEPDKLQDDIEAYLGDDSVRLTNNNENYRQTKNMFTLISIFLYGFIIVITLIGITNVFNTITTNMELRRPEFAMLRSVGMTSKEFNRMIRLESVFMGTRALMIGIPIGLLLSYALYRFMAAEAGVAFKVPVVALIAAVFAVFILISLIMTYSMSKIKKHNTIETIRNENI